MPDIYDKHDAAFKNVSAYVITNKEGERIATVAFKFGTAVTAYVHLISWPMEFGIAKGGGYDRQSAAVSIAARKIDVENSPEWSKVLKKALLKDGGARWDDVVRDSGFNVLQAV